MSAVSIRLYDGTGKFLCLLPARGTVEVSAELNAEGAGTLTYPAMGKGADTLLGLDDGQIAVHLDGTEVFRFLFEDDQDDEAAGQARNITIGGPGSLAYLRRGVVLPQNGVTKKPAEWAFDNATPGKVMLDLIGALQSRGYLLDVHTSFTATTDSNGQAWAKQIDITYDAGKDLLTVVKDLAAQQTCDVRMRGLTLDLYNPEGVLAVDRPSVFVRKSHAGKAPRKRSRKDLRTDFLVVGDDGVNTIRSDATAGTTYGKRIGYIGQGNTTTSGTLARIGDDALKENARPAVGHSFELRLDAPSCPRPFADFQLGDKIRSDYVLTADGGSHEPLRVRSIAVTVDQKGLTKANVEVNDRFTEAILDLKKRIDGVVHGAVTNAAPPPKTTTPSRDEVPPAAPANVLVSATAYITPDGSSLARAEASWDEVTTNYNGSVCDDLSHYEVEFTLPDGTGRWTGTKSTTGLSVVWDTLPCGQQFKVRVYAVDVWGNRSVAGTSLQIELPTDDGPPPTPSLPTATDELGVVVVNWNGLAEDGSPMPADFLLAQVHASQVSGYTPVSGAGGTLAVTLAGAGRTVITGLPYDVPSYVRLVAVDRTGNLSGPTAEVEVIPTRLVGDDIADGSIDAGKVSFDARALGAISTYYLASPPTGAQQGDLWVDTDDGNKLYRYDGVAWVSIRDNGITQAVQDAAGAAAAVDGKITTYAQDNPPGGGTVGVPQVGVNLSGGEAGSVFPGVYGTDYAYPSDASIQYLAGQVQVLRLPIRWERVQPTRLAALDATEVARITAVLDSAAAANLPVILDVHNFGRFIEADGTERIIGDGTLSESDLVDLWTRLTQTFSGHAALAGYDLMSAPHDLIGAPSGFIPTGTIYAWDDGTVQGWAGENTATVTLATQVPDPTPPPDPTPTSTKSIGYNVSGAEFGSARPGTYGVDYAYPSAETIAFLAGHATVLRLPFAWERVQPTRQAALDATEVGRITAVLDAAATAGLTVLLDVHNYGRFTDPDGTEHVFGDGTLTEADFTDLWTRLAATFGGHAALGGYDLMNEPHDLVGSSGTFAVNNTAYSWDDGTVQGWGGEGTTTVAAEATNVHDGTGSLAATKPDLTVGAGNTIRFNDANHNTLAVANGDTLSAWVLVPSGATGTWKAHLEMQNTSYQWNAGKDVALTPGVWTQITYTPDSTLWSGHRSVGIQFTVTNPTRTSETVYLDSFQQGAIGSAMTPAQLWESLSQAAVDAIRASGDTTPIYVEGHSWSSAPRWVGQHPTAWITDPADKIIYEAHFYFDSNNGGTYNDTYAVANTAAVNAGYADLTAKSKAEVGQWLTWLSDNGAKGLLGEIGWPDDADSASWGAVGDAVLADCDAAGVGFTYWATGERWGTGYDLSSYVDSDGDGAIDLAKAQAAIVEAYLTTSGGDTGGGTVTTGSTFDQAILADSPTAYFALDPSDPTDLTGNGHTLTFPAGTPATQTLANGDVIALFDGATQYAEIADADDLSVTTTGILTFMAVISPATLEYPNAETSGDGNCVYPLIKGVNYQTTGDQEWCLRTYSQSAARPNRVSGYVFNADGGLGAGSYFQGGVNNTDASAPPLMQVGDEILVHVKIDTVNLGADGYGTVRIYRNGVLQDHDSMGDPYYITPVNNGAPVHIGARPGHSYFSGAVGKVAVFGGDLTDAQIAAHYAAFTSSTQQTSGAGTSSDGFTLVQDWEDGTTQGWVAENTATADWTDTPAYEGTGVLILSRTDLDPAGSGQTFRVNDAGTNSGLVAADGDTLRIQVLVPGGVGGTWQSRLQMKRSDGTSVVGSYTTLTPGTWGEVTLTPAAADWDGHGQITVQTTVNSPGVAAESIYLDSFRQGNATVALVAGATAAPVHDGADALAVTRTDLVADQLGQTLRANDANSNTLNVADGDTLTAWVLAPSDATGSWQAHLELQDSSYTWHAGPDASLTPGTWAQLTFTPDAATWSGHKGVAVQFTVDNPTRTTETAYVDTIEQGSISTGTTGVQVWESASQAAVDAIRQAGDSTTTIYVEGYGSAAAATWTDHHGLPWINDPAGATVYEAHLFFDADGSGAYADAYATVDQAAVSAGFADLTTKARSELAEWTTWLSQHGVDGFLGEIGWPDDADAASWNAVGSALLDDLASAGIGSTYWAAGDWAGTAGPLWAYVDSDGDGTLDAAHAQATVIAAHQPGTVTPLSLGDLWIDTNDGNKLYRWNGSAWQLVRDSGIGQALQDAESAKTDASTALTTADGKNTVIYSDGQPAGGAYKTDDLWFDSSDGNKPYRWNGSAWVEAPLGDSAIANLDAGKITTGQMDAARIDVTNLRVDTAQIKDAAITTAKIANLAVQNAQIADLDGGKIHARSIRADQLVIGVMQTNLVRNPGFEDTGFYPAVAGPYATVPGWTMHHQLYGSGQFEIAYGGFQAITGVGKAVLKTDATGAGGAEVSGDQLESEAFPVQAGSDYQLAFKVYNAYYERIYGRVHWSTDGGASWIVDPNFGIEAVQPHASGNNYTTLNGASTAPAGATLGKVVISNNGNGSGASTVCIEDVSVMQVGQGAIEITSAGIRMWDEEGAETISLSAMGVGGNFITLGGGLASIDDGGNISGTTLSAASDVTVQGRALVGSFVDYSHPNLSNADSLLNSLPRGLVAYGVQMYSGWSLGPRSTHGIMELDFNAEPGRAYKLTVDPFLVICDQQDIVVALDGFLATPSYAGGVASSPSTSANRILTGYKSIGTAYQALSGTSVLRCNAYGDTAYGGELTAGLNRILLAIYNSSAAATVSVYDAVPLVASIEDIGLDTPDTGQPLSSYYSGGTSGGSGSGSTTTKTTYTKSYGATWTRSFTGSGGYNSYYGSHLVQGYYSSNNGNQRAMVGFNDAQIRSDLSGASILSATLTLYSTWWYYNAGGTAVIGTHASSSAPSTFSGTPDRLRSSSWPKSYRRTVNLGTTIGNDFRTGAARGITLGPGPTTSHEYYGKFAGVGESYAPVLTIKYSK